MKEAANDLDPTSITTAKVIATHAAASRHNPHDTEIRTTPTLSAQPSTSMQPDRRCDDDEVRRSHAPEHLRSESSRDKQNRLRLSVGMARQDLPPDRSGFPHRESRSPRGREKIDLEAPRL